jgi:N-acetylneuraminic acid mutarotase
MGVAVTERFLYAVGGAPNGPTTGTLEVYNAVTDTWSTKAPMPTPRHSLGVGVVNGVLYAIGGHNSAVNASGLLATVEAYNPATNTWTSKTPMSVARYGLGVAGVNGIIYAIGGDGPNGVVRTVEAYDPATDTWTTKAPLPVGRYVFGIGVLNGAIYVAAGGDEVYETVAYLLRYDPATDSWSYKAPVAGGPRREHSAAVVGGVLYVVGGSSATTPYLTRVEAYQP